MRKGKVATIRLTLLLAWLAFTLSLIVWWLIFAMRQLERLLSLQHESAEQFARYHKMLMWEGGTLVLSLTAGAIAMAWYMFQEIKQRERLKEFLATFTHELKTPVAGLILQAELLREKLKAASELEAANRLIEDACRLTLQLDNCLYLARRNERDQGVSLLLENTCVNEVLQGLIENWPQLDFEIEGDGKVLVDRRAFVCILQNIIQNAVSHGQASKISIKSTEIEERIQLELLDNGSGFKSNVASLGQLFKRHYGGSGSGIGLYLVRELAHSMNAKVDFIKLESGFKVLLDLPKGR